MSLNFGRTQLAIPGPSVVPERVLRAMHRPSPNIYEGELIDITESLIQDLKTVAQTKFDAVIYISNGHGVWEAALRNTIAPGEKILVVSTGKFALKWSEVAETMGIEVDFLEFGMRDCVDPEKLYETLKKDQENEIKAVLMVQTDTASSVINDVQACRKSLDDAKHDALFMVDCIASLGCDQYEMDAWGVDITVAGCQKGLMTPAGLGFLYFNEKAEAKRENLQPGQYWDWRRRANPEIFYHRFNGTAPTHHLFGLREALDILVYEEGIKNAWKRHETIAKSVWAAIEAWSDSGELAFNIEDPRKRSNAVTTVRMKDGNAKRLREWTEIEAGVTLGIGLGFDGPAFDDHFRIGHMGHQNIPMTMGALGSIDAGLVALDIKRGKSALSKAAKVLAKHKKS